jgi:hypothetical protein
MVVAILTMVLGVLLPALGSFFNSTRGPNARNLISVNLTLARNYAVANNVNSALVFVAYDDPDGGRKRTLMFLIEPDPDNAGEFLPVAGQKATNLPDNIMVHDDPDEAIAIWFLPVGQLTERDTDASDIKWPEPTNPADVDWAKELYIYDSTAGPYPGDWEELYHLYINYYTGAVIEE